MILKIHYTAPIIFIRMGPRKLYIPVRTYLRHSKSYTGVQGRETEYIKLSPRLLTAGV
jgi:hypothetical protein